ncbi:putative SAC3/GANP family [Leishmania naiffi]|uniref:SAC3/GANP family n=1 Tax=Leishmania naiffi TaxID=5678 RepID=A0AAW3B9G5_9TRYP
MPPDFPDCASEWWQESRRSCENSSSSTTTPYENSTRAALLVETMRRAPAPLQPFVQQGFSLYDREVVLGRRRYEQVTFVEMLNIAKSLQMKAPPAPVPSPASSLTPLPPSPMCNALVAQTAPTTHTTSIAPISHKRAAPEAVPHEPPHKRAVLVTTTSVPLNDKAFFFQLAGITDAEVAATREFVGTSTELERNYTRYEPLVEDIRPLAVLKDAYAHITTRATALEKTEGKKAAQKYLSDQLKGMRQDLRVQNIVDNFTVMVYEVHARLCLETGDIGEFNQCQAGLKQFYAMDAVDLRQCDVKNFFLYRLVYLTLSGQYDSLSTELIHFTNAQLQGTDRVGSNIAREPVNRTLALCAACNNGDTPSLCCLLLSFETEMTYLVRIYLQKLRIMWLKEILTAMKGSLTLRFLMTSLGFTPHPHGKKKRQLFWLDDAEESAWLRFTELFQTLKVELPPDFSFHEEVKRRKHTGSNPQAHYPSLDAATALKAVNDYLVFLGTRKDAGRT